MNVFMRRHFMSGILFLWAVFGQVADAKGPVHFLSKKTAPELLSLLDDSDPGIRGEAARTMGSRFGDPATTLPAELVPKLVKLLDSDPDRGVRMEVVWALWDLKPQVDTTPHILRALNDTDGCVRMWATDALIVICADDAKVLSEKVIPTLTRCLEPSNDADIAWQAAWRLGLLGPKAKDAIPELEKLRNHSVDKVKRYACEAVAKILNRKSVVVRKGDTLTKIAKQNHITVETLEHVNWLENGAILKVGCQIWLEEVDTPAKVVKPKWISPRMFPQI